MESNSYFRKFKNSVKENKIDVIFLIGLFLISFGVKTIPSTSPQFKGVYGFDPTWHARMVRYIVQDGYRPEWDPIAYWPESRVIFEPPLYHNLAAYGYQAVASVTTGSSEYQEGLFFHYMAMLPALAGGLAAAGMYLLGKGVRNRKAGLLAGLFLAVQPTVLFRSMYGFCEEDALGIALTVITLAAFVWAFKKGSWKRGAVAGASLASLILVWTFAPFTIAFIPLFVFINALFVIASKEYNELEHKLEVMAGSIIPTLLIPAAAFAWSWNMDIALRETMKWMGFFVPVIAFLLITSYYFNYHKKENTDKIHGIEKKKIYHVGIALALIVGGAFLAIKGTWLVDYIGNLFESVGQPSKLSRTIGEEHPKGFEGILKELRFEIWGLAIPFLLGLLYLPLRRFVKWKNPRIMDLVPFLFAGITFYLYMNKGKMGYIFGPASSLLVGVVLADFIGAGGWLVKKKKITEEMGKWIKIASVAIVTIMFFVQLSIAVSSMDSYKRKYLPQPGWTTMYEYLKANTNPEEIVMMTWWDYGHWTSWHNIKTTLDNTNANETKVIKTAKIFTDLRGNTSSELEEKHLERMRNWGVTHVAIDRTLLTNKWGALTYLADNRCIPNTDLEKYGLSFPTLTQLTQRYGLCVGSASCPSGYGCTYVGEVGMIQCYPYTTKGEESVQSGVRCNMFQDSPPLVFTNQEWAEMENTSWPGYDLTINMGNGQLQTMKAYTQPDYKLMFFKVNRIGLVPDAPVNYMLGLRWFFQDKTLEHSVLLESEEYMIPNNEVVLYRIKE